MGLFMSGLAFSFFHFWKILVAQTTKNINILRFYLNFQTRLYREVMQTVIKLTHNTEKNILCTIQHLISQSRLMFFIEYQFKHQQLITNVFDIYTFHHQFISTIQLKNSHPSGVDGSDQHK